MTKILAGGLAFIVLAIAVVQNWPPTWSFSDAVIYAIVLFLTPLLVVLFWLTLHVALIAAFHLFTSKEQRDIAYELDDQGITVRDATGASLSCPWSVVRGARETARAIRFEIKPMTSRYVPKRAFGESELADLRALIARQLGTKAKLKKTR